MTHMTSIKIYMIHSAMQLEHLDLKSQKKNAFNNLPLHSCFCFVFVFITVTDNF